DFKSNEALFDYKDGLLRDENQDELQATSEWIRSKEIKGGYRYTRTFNALYPKKSGLLNDRNQSDSLLDQYDIDLKLKDNGEYEQSSNGAQISSSIHTIITGIQSFLSFKPIQKSTTTLGSNKSKSNEKQTHHSSVCSPNKLTTPEQIDSKTKNQSYKGGKQTQTKGKGNIKSPSSSSSSPYSLQTQSNIYEDGWNTLMEFIKRQSEIITTFQGQIALFAENAMSAAKLHRKAEESAETLAKFRQTIIKIAGEAEI
ncbi:MAG: hypothetical protein EZS28_053638, partial [Streblomastix strix]